MRKAFETLGLAPKWQQPRRSRGEEETADGTPGRHELTRLRSSGWRTRRAGPGPSAPPASGVLCPPRAAELNGPCLARAPCLALSIPRCVNPGREARERRAASAGSACPGDEAHTHVHLEKHKTGAAGTSLSLPVHGSGCRPEAPAADLRGAPAGKQQGHPGNRSIAGQARNGVSLRSAPEKGAAPHGESPDRPRRAAWHVPGGPAVRTPPPGQVPVSLTPRCSLHLGQ